MTNPLSTRREFFASWLASEDTMTLRNAFDGVRAHWLGRGSRENPLLKAHKSHIVVWHGNRLRGTLAIRFNDAILINKKLDNLLPELKEIASAAGLSIFDIREITMSRLTAMFSATYGYNYYPADPLAFISKLPLEAKSLFPDMNCSVLMRNVRVVNAFMYHGKKACALIPNGSVSRAIFYDDVDEATLEYLSIPDPMNYQLVEI